MIFVRPEYLEAATSLVDRVYGGLDGYLTRALDLSPEEIARLRERLSS